MDKFILITGGTKGIGKAVASCLGKAGYNLILTYASDQAAAEEVRSELVGHFDIQVSILRADISDRNTSVQFGGNHFAFGCLFAYIIKKQSA